MTAESNDTHSVDTDTDHDHIDTDATGTAELAEPEAALNRLIQLDIVVENDDGTLATTTEYEDIRRIYHDTYMDAPRDRIITTITDIFDVEESDAITRLEEDIVSRADIISYLAIDSYTDRALDPATHAMMVEVVKRIDPESPVPDAITELTDESYDSFITEHSDALVTVWKRRCDPCRAVKSDLDTMLEAIPSDVAVAGIDGENAPSFRRKSEVSTAPAFIQYKDGEQCSVKTGRQSPDAVANMFDDV
jgi:hypothetical protein